MKKIVLLSLSLLFVCSCHRNEFHIQGQVKEGAGKTLYFDAVQLSRTTELDSARLSADGAFSFYAARPEYPEFYRLRLDSSSVYLAVDSTETITVDIARLPIAADYRVDGSPESEKIRHIAQAGARLKGALENAGKQKNLSAAEQKALIEKLQDEIARYKESVTPYIMEAPASLAAYFAIFQQVNGLDVFDRNKREDNRFIMAVANAYYSLFPESPRAKHLYELALVILQNERQRSQPRESAVPAAVEVSLIDIELPDCYGKKHRLSDLKGNVVLLDFAAYEGKNAPEYNRALVQLHDRYHEQGFEIYQVSLDTDENLWQVSADNLPWVCVRDAETSRSRVARSYNVQSLPTAFLIDRNGVLQQRVESLQALPEAIEKMLRQKSK